jgi:DNA-binding response OmpR family regulator
MNLKTNLGTILLVDDEALVRKSAAAMLNAGNFEVTEAVDGLDAVAKFQANPGGFRLVVMDISMPRLNGILAARKMRELDPAARIIFISGSRLTAPPEAEADGFLTKPLRGKDLLNSVNRVLRDAKPRARSAE